MKKLARGGNDDCAPISAARGCNTTIMTVCCKVALSSSLACGLDDLRRMSSMGSAFSQRLDWIILSLHNQANKEREVGHTFQSVFYQVLPQERKGLFKQVQFHGYKLANPKNQCQMGSVALFGGLMLHPSRTIIYTFH